MELKKFLIEKMEGNKFIQRSDEQRNLYKALVDAYEAEKTILDSYGETVILKRRRDDDDDQEEEPSAGSDQGSKRRREGKEPESASAPLETATRSAGMSTTGSKSRQVSASESAFAKEHMQTISQMDEPSYSVFETGAYNQTIVQSSHHPEWLSQPKKPPTPDHDWNKTLPDVQGSTRTWISELAKQVDFRSSFNELLDTPLDISNFIMNRLRVDTLTPELLARPTFELMKGSCTNLIELEYHLEKVYKATMDRLDWVNPEGQQYPHNLLQPLPLIPDNRGRCVIPFAHFINNDLEYLWGGASSRKYTTSLTKTKAADYGNIKWIEDLFYGFIVNQEFALDVYSKRRIIAVMDLKIVEWHSYKHLDCITVRRDDDKLYKFKEGDFKRLRLQDIEDMLLLLVQGKLYNLTGKRILPIQTQEDSSTKTRTRKTGIRMQYLPQTIWRKGDKDRASPMIQAIDKMLKTRRIMRSLERFIGGRLSILADLQADKEVPISEGSSVTTTKTYMETYKNVLQDIHDQLNVEAEAVQIILTGIDNDIYSTVDACPNACEMWKAIKRLKQGELINVQDLETKLYWEFRKFTSQDGESLESYYSRECQKLKRAKDAAYHREKMLLCKQKEAGIQLNAEQADWRDNTDDELENQELEAHYMYIAQIQEVSPDAADSGPIFDSEPVQKVSTDDHYNVFAIESEHPEQSESVHDTYPIEQDEHNVIIDSLDISYDREQIDQNDDDDDLANERELLASLIEKLKCEIDDNKNRNKFLKTSNKVLIEKLKGETEDSKTKV
nr:hypothetical protein [Tanacetum cinerariifolium]